jgi:hypothetical protein
MIIKQQYAFYDAVGFAEGLQKAARGILRVTAFAGPDESSTRTTIVTAWLITDTLAVLPDYGVSLTSSTDGSPRFSCRTGALPGREIEADLIWNVPGSMDGSKPALLRLKTPLSGAALSLGFTSAVVGEQVFVLQYTADGDRPKLSVGDLTGIEGLGLQHIASTEAGAGGAPIFRADGWNVIGMHVQSNTTLQVNEGLAIEPLLDALRASPFWSEIAQHQNIVDVAAVRQDLESGRSKTAAPERKTSLMATAVHWDFDPEAIPEDARGTVVPLVIDPSAERWSLRANDRLRLIRSAGSLDALREARGTAVLDTPGQQVIDQILKGPPYALDQIEEEALPYWLQAVRWFADVAPGLPTAGEVNRALKQRRVRSQMQSLAGPGFRGRATELATMKAWYDNAQAGPIVVTGIGGIGKSALVARFALNLPERTLVLWLDFDRADLAPDDAVSVLSLLCEQASVQLERFIRPTIDPDAWEAGADAFGAELTRTLGDDPTPLLVLDGFEVAQHVQQYQEIWEVLNRILAKAPVLRVIVSGRAPVEDLVLNGRSGQPLVLTGMAPEDAEAWLREHGIAAPTVLPRVLEISQCVPLNLMLAVRLVQVGGEVQDLPSTLPRALVEGFLYRRILDRVIDAKIKPMTWDVLVLRRVTEAMISELLADSIPEDMTANDVFALLTRELGLAGTDAPNRPESQAPALAQVGKGGMLRLRPEVRSATLRLLEMDNLARVREVDQRAADWYAKPDPDANPSADDLNVRAAELVYHRLRLGDLAGAKLAWRDGCAPLLLDVEQDLPETALAERAWIRAQTDAAAGRTVSVEAWEREAVERIRDAVQRGLLRVVPGILTERPARSAASPLVLYDVWMRWRAGDLEGARVALEAAGEVDGPVGRERAVLGALLAVQDGDRPTADRLLASMQEESRWSDHPNPRLDALAVQAARVRLTVDLPGEVTFGDRVKDPSVRDMVSRILRGVLTSADLMLPHLSDWTVDMPAPEAAGSGPRVPTEPTELERFARELEEEQSWSGEPSRFFFPTLTIAGPESSALGDAWKARDIESYLDVIRRLPPPSGSRIELGVDLAVLAWRRRRLVTTGLFLTQACEQARGTGSPADALSMAVTATLAAFRSQDLHFVGPDYSFGNVDEVLKQALSLHRSVVVPPPRDRVALALDILRRDASVIGPFRDQVANALVRRLEEAAGGFYMGSRATRSLTEYFMDLPSPELRASMLYVLGPDPLEVLFRRAVRLPDTAEW